MLRLAMNRAALRQRLVPEGDPASEVVVLAVGDVFSFNVRIEADVAGDRTAIADFCDITPDLMAMLGPQVVVSSVLGRNFDCVDLAEKLSDMGYDGCYRLIGHGIPQPELVLREIRGLFPKLHVELDTPAK